MERARILRHYLGEADPIEQQNQRLATKIRHLKRMRDDVIMQREEIQQMIVTTAEREDRQALREEIRELNKIIDNQTSAITGLEGQLKL